MTKLIPVQYMKLKYPPGIKPKLIEVPAHFDSQQKVPNNIEYSLHTEYSYSKRKFTSPACEGLEWVKKANKNGIPMLWFNQEWVTNFTSFVYKFVGENHPPKIIEIHPPFNDYCRSSTQFIHLYKKFEEKILAEYPKTQILIENRYGSHYRGGDFLISTLPELKALVKDIRTNELDIKLVLDIPQLFSAHGLEPNKMSKEKISRIFEELYQIREYIAGIHLWGKCIGRDNRPASHVGTLDSYFGGTRCGEHTTISSQAKRLKEHFLAELYTLLDDGIARYLVPEVNNKAALYSILKDLTEFGFKFV